MKNERLLIADDKYITLITLSRGIEYFGKEDGHIVVGKASSVDEVRSLIEGGLRPTVAIVDHRFPYIGAGEEASEIIRKLSPETKIVSFSSDSELKWGDENWNKEMDPKQLVDALTNLQH